MNCFFRYQGLFLMILMLLAACSPAASAPGEGADDSIPTRELLGKTLADTAVAKWLNLDSCSRAAEFLLCKESGLAFWLDPNQVIRKIYLYVNNAAGFEPYKGELPFGLKFYDTLAAVEYKLHRQNLGISGRPDQTGTPDHFHYWATYRQAGLTVIYNAPFPDEDATIYAVLISQ